MRLWLLCLLVLWPTRLTAQHRPLDYALLGSSTALIVADWSQTVNFREHDGTEGNPILGTRPSVGRVNTLLSLAALTNGAAFFLPRIPRRLWYATIIAAETWAVAGNLSLGWGIGF